MTYSKSIIQEDMDYCIICGRYGTEIHHVLGASNRKWSTKYGLVVGLCYDHHRGRFGVHQQGVRFEIKENGTGEVHRDLSERGFSSHIRAKLFIMP